MDSTDSLRSSGALRIIYAMHAIGFLDLLGVSLIIPLVTHHARSLGASPSTLGAMGSLYGALQLFTGPLVGQFSDIYGRHSVLLVVLVGAMVAYFIAGISTMLWVLIVARVLAGLFKHSLSVARTWLADFVPHSERPKHLGHYNAISTGAFIIGPTIGGHIASASENGFFICSMLTVLMFFLAFLLTLIVPRWIPAKMAKGGAAGNDVRRQEFEEKFVDPEISPSQVRPLELLQQLWHITWTQVPDIMLIRFAMGFAMILFRSNFSLFLEMRFQSTPIYNGYLMSASGLMGATSSFLVGSVTEAYGGCSRRLLVHMACLMALAQAGMTFAPSYSLFVVSMIPLSLSGAVFRVNLTHLSVDRGSQEQRGAMLGVGQSVMSFARMIAPFFAGVLTELGGILMPGVASIFCAGIASVLIATRLQLSPTSTDGAAKKKSE
eukprot:scpid62477/ scgid3799/ Major facilitator superfamily domain-containing protein 9